MRRLALVCLVPLVLLGCTPGPKSSSGFRLPDGDAEAGKVAFVELSCVKCHAVEGAEFADPVEEGSLQVKIGGKVRRVRTYGELVTAIINPSHDIAPSAKEAGVTEDGTSLMPDYNAAISVQQLVDLVAFLQSRYEEHLPRDYDPYFP